LKLLEAPPCVLEAATDADLDSLVALERACFSHPWSARNLQAAIEDRERGGVLVLRTVEAPRQHGIAAYCIFQIVADEMGILDLGVDPRWRRRGLGRWMLERTLALGARRGASAAFLEVRQSNWPALGLYRSEGFEVISRRRDYYERPLEDAFVLRKRTLSGEPRAGSRDP
jgi:ribosomal-protein-alanine N-acetyltransferase